MRLRTLKDKLTINNYKRMREPFKCVYGDFRRKGWDKRHKAIVDS